MREEADARISGPLLAGLVGAGVTVLIAFAEAAAMEAKSREYDMGGIPLLFAAWGFIPFAGGAAAGLAAPRRVYLAAAIAWVGSAIVGGILNSMPGPDRPVEGFLLPLPFTIPFALWGALIVDLRPRFRAFRDGSMVFTALMSLVAIIPIADYWFPGKSGWILAGLVVAFFVWISRRSRSAPTTQRSGTGSGQSMA